MATLALSALVAALAFCNVIGVLDIDSDLLLLAVLMVIVMVSLSIRNTSKHAYPVDAG